jgi:hypothetical protein
MVQIEGTVASVIDDEDEDDLEPEEPLKQGSAYGKAGRLTYVGEASRCPSRHAAEPKEVSLVIKASRMQFRMEMAITSAAITKQVLSFYCEAQSVLI